MTFAGCRDDIDAGQQHQLRRSRADQLTIGNDGELAEAVFEMFGFDETGRDYSKGTVRVPVSDVHLG